MNCFCGIDIGGTGVKLALLDEDKRMLASDDFSTDSIHGIDAFLHALITSLEKMKTEVPGMNVLAAGIGCTGPVNVETGIVENPFTLPELERLGIARAFDHIFISSQYGIKKPSPAFFSALNSIGMDLSEMLMIGNDDICDCHGAAAAGIDSLYIRTEQSPEPHLPFPVNNRKITTLSEVLNYC